MNYDSTSYELTVVVTDEGAGGQLTATVKKGETVVTPTEGPEYTKFDFSNTYKAAAVDLRIVGHKTLTGRTLKENEFSFRLSGGNLATPSVVTNAADGTIYFGKLSFDKPGDYKFTAEEDPVDPDSNPGVTPDSKVYTFTVSVTDDGTGQLKAELSGDTRTGSDLDFTNTYKAGTTYKILGGKKTFTGFPTDSSIKHIFTFELEEKGKVIGKATVDHEGEFRFDSITYEETGTHIYTAEEMQDHQPGVTYDRKSYTVIVDVTDDGKGNLVATCKDAAGSEITGTDCSFTNTYKAAPVDIQFNGTKTLEGKSLTADQFSFSLTGPDGTNETVKNAADGTIVFSKLTFTKPGKYTYKVKELPTTEPGIIIDKSVYDITVMVTDPGTGHLQAVLSGGTTTGSGLDFTNRYDPKAAEVYLSGTKTLQGKTLKADEFSFVLEGSDGTKETVKNAEDGSICFSKLVFTKAGTYTYTVKEVPTSESHITIDTKVYNITVTVKDDGAGKLTASLSGDTVTGTDLDFVNKYTSGGGGGGGTGGGGGGGGGTPGTPITPGPTLPTVPTNLVNPPAGPSGGNGSGLYTNMVYFTPQEKFRNLVLGASENRRNNLVLAAQNYRNNLVLGASASRVMTGDAANLGLYLLLLFASIATLGAAFVVKRKRKDEEE